MLPSTYLHPFKVRRGSTLPIPAWNWSSASLREGAVEPRLSRELCSREAAQGCQVSRRGHGGPHMQGVVHPHAHTCGSKHLPQHYLAHQSNAEQGQRDSFLSHLHVARQLISVVMLRVLQQQPTIAVGAVVSKHQVYMIRRRPCLSKSPRQVACGLEQHLLLATAGKRLTLWRCMFARHCWEVVDSQSRCLAPQTHRAHQQLVGLALAAIAMPRHVGIASS